MGFIKVPLLTELPLCYFKKNGRLVLWKIFSFFNYSLRKLKEFNTFSIYQVLPSIIELWGLNVQTEVESKKNFAQLTAR